MKQNSRAQSSTNVDERVKTIDYNNDRVVSIQTLDQINIPEFPSA
jgi:hypothetical protein